MRFLILLLTMLFALTATGAVWADDDDDRIDIDRASWSNDRDRLSVRGDKAPRRTTVTIRYGNRGDNGAVIGTTQSDGDGDWEFRISGDDLGTVPCDVTAQAAGVDDDDKEVRRAPRDCSNDGGAPQPPAAQCSDGIDNDGDGLTDFPADPGCADANDNDEFNTAPPPVAQCDDGIDNDGDGLIDFPNDPGCDNANDNDEFNAPPPVVECNDGIDNDDDGLIDFPNDPGCANANDNDEFNAPPPPVAQCSDGIDNDGDGLIDFPADPGCANANDDDEANAPPPQVNCVPVTNGLSINSTSQDGCPEQLVPEEPTVLNGNFSVVAINDLGMHCGDLDTRISSILPPFQVLLAQVIQKGATPILNPAGVSLEYSAASNPNDPILAADPNVVQRGLRDDGSTYKTNFWDVIGGGAYDPFYPAGVTPLLTGPFPVTHDVGLPVPNAEELYIGADGLVNSGDEQLTAVQHAMPGLTNPYLINAPTLVEEHYGDKPFFVNFPFGYIAEAVNWYEGAGIPFAAYDDYGRENAYPLVRVEARQGNNTVATVDTVLPISGEASCTNCHSDPADVQNSRTSQPTDTLLGAGLPVATSLDDPDPTLPTDVSVEYAADINILRLHDLKHGLNYVDPFGAATPCDVNANAGDGDANCLINKALVQGNAVVCQVCHYTPALDLAQVGPAAGAEGNGRNQVAHSSNSNVMHSHHGGLGNLFPDMPAPDQLPDGTITNQTERLNVLQETCYQCHPGTNVQCLRGAMFNGGMLCNDCHGNMEQVGNDFSAGVSPQNPGAFILDQGNFYDPNSGQPRVPWANEPGCGSCHTGDFNTNIAGDNGTMTNTADVNGNTDGIRLRRAYLTGDAKATPIVPADKRFAEPAVPADFNGFANPGAGNPQLYRVSTGHGGVMCEGCHGATHAEWPNANPASNDNVTSNQLQGHTGVIIECSTCHGTANLGNTLNGPHGMHPVGNDTNVNNGAAAGPRISFVDGGHSNINTNGCDDCHGGGGRGNNQGTVLSVAKKARSLNGQTIQPGEPVGCNICH